MARIPVNKPARLTASFLNEATPPVKYDPTQVKLRVALLVQRSGQRLYETTYIYPSGDGTIVKDSTGEYHADITMTEPGQLQYQWQGDNALDPINWDTIEIAVPPFSG